MRVALSTVGKFHTFDLARELHARGVLAGIYTGYPRFKLRQEGLPQELIHTFPWVNGAYMAARWKHRLPRPVLQQWEHINSVTFARWVERSLPECDLYVGLSGSSLRAGRRARRLGVRYVCDRGSSHIRVQDRLLREEHALWGMPFSGIDSRIIEREEAEYAEADCITVPSRFVLRSFVEQGLAESRLRLLPYGVNLSRFQPVASPHAGRFDVLFVGGMSLRKGVPYLVKAYKELSHPAKSLTFVGAPALDLIAQLRTRGLWPEDAKVVGHVPQAQLKNLMSRSHVMVLPSIEEGLAMVQAQAMACACPIIASRNTGCEDLFDDGVEGFIVPARDARALTERMQRLADAPALRSTIAQRALDRVQRMGGWSEYGGHALSVYRAVVAA